MAPFLLVREPADCLVLRRQEPPPSGKMRAERFCIRRVRALPSAPRHPCFPLTEDLHGCRSVAVFSQRVTELLFVCVMLCQSRRSIRPQLSVLRTGEGDAIRPQVSAQMRRNAAKFYFEIL